MSRDAPTVWVLPVFAEIDALPGAERRPAVAHRQAERGLRQQTADVGRHVVGSLGIVAEEWIPPRDQALPETLDVPHDLRVGVLLDHQGCAGVLDLQGQESVMDSGTVHPRHDMACHLVDAGTLGLDGPLVEQLSHPDAPAWSRFLRLGSLPAGAYAGCG